MRLLARFALVVLVVATTRLDAGFAVVQQSSVVSGTGSNVVSISATSAGELAVVGVRIQGVTDTITSVTDDKSNTYACSTNVDYSSRRIYLCYGVQTTGGTTSVTVAYSGTQTHRAYVAVFSGGAASNAAAFDTSATGTNTGSALSVSTMTLAASGELVVAWAGTASTQTYTAGTGYTLYYPTNPDVTNFEYNLSATTSETAPMTSTGTPVWAEIAIAFKEAPTPTPTPTSTPTNTPTPTATPTNTPGPTPTPTSTPTPTPTPTRTPTPTPTNTPGPAATTRWFMALVPSH